VHARALGNHAVIALPTLESTAHGQRSRATHAFTHGSLLILQGHGSCTAASHSLRDLLIRLLGYRPIGLLAVCGPRGVS
jgi:hypothetical protein